jgi:hypothetical protein
MRDNADKGMKGLVAMKKAHLILNTAIFVTLILLLIVALICGPDLLGV